MESRDLFRDFVMEDDAEDGGKDHEGEGDDDVREGRGD